MHRWLGAIYLSMTTTGIHETYTISKFLLFFSRKYSAVVVVSNLRNLPLSFWHRLMGAGSIMVLGQKPLAEILAWPGFDLAPVSSFMRKWTRLECLPFIIFMCTHNSRRQTASGDHSLRDFVSNWTDWPFIPPPFSCYSILAAFSGKTRKTRQVVQGKVKPRQVVQS